MPDREYKGFWHRILHDQTAESIERDLSKLAHANVTTVPFHFRNRRAARETDITMLPPDPISPEPSASPLEAGQPQSKELTTRGGYQPISSATWRTRGEIAGRVRTVRAQPIPDSSSLDLVLEDATGAISVVFLGRKRIAGIEVGTQMSVAGTVGTHRGRLAILNPTYVLARR